MPALRIARGAGASPMLHGFDHIAIAVPSLDQALPIWRDLLGFEMHGIEVVADQKVRVAILTKGGDRVELVEPTSVDSPVAKYIAKHGPGLHHVCLLVDGLKDLLDRLKASGVQLIDEEPKPGANGRDIAFVHPRSVGGVLIELSEKRRLTSADDPEALA